MRGVLRVLPVAIALALVVPALLVPRLFGWVGLPMTSTALEPGIPAGSLVIVDPVSAQDRDTLTMRVGDVATFTPQVGSEAVVTRRITAIEPETGGRRLDLAPGQRTSADEMTAQVDQVRAIARYHIPLLGKVIGLAPPAHRPWWARSFAFACLAYAGWELWRRRKNLLANADHGGYADHADVKDQGCEAIQGRDRTRRASRSRSHPTRSGAEQRSPQQRLAARLDALAGTLRFSRRTPRGRHRASPEDVAAAVQRQNLDIERVATIHPICLGDPPTSSNDAGRGRS